ncbi:hypothetical protein AYO40_04385 [Planctomycetaceae bacterium SCGC AG-212-D15]|nr:hypothetical protein AYO40_04385 [Planctomycetaceae bacterium SCGC AG-212-D15]
MKTFVAALVTILALAAAAPKDDAKKAESREGTWKASAIEYNGEQVLGETVKDLKITLTADRFTVSGDAPEIERYGRFTYKLDAKAKPATIDLTMVRGDDKGVTLNGIYQRKGDELELCLSLTPKERPKEFKSEGGTNVVRAVFKRDKK